MTSLRVDLIPVLRDNYAFLLEDSGTGAIGIVDPGEAAPVLEMLHGRGDRLDWILITHHHGDHVGGVPELVAATGCRVAGPAAERRRLPPLDRALAEGDELALGGSTATVIETPGHTAGHITFWFEAARALFCGDTLFAMGCGRLLEGDAATMWRSLGKLAVLPEDARVYCGHEYTLSNARFAQTVEPGNAALVERAAGVAALRERGAATIPSTLGQEMATNPFLRAGNEARFAELRRAKDRA
jgi:hydroxyacylglutathione hydrolase